MPADRARAHLLDLRRRGVGYRAAADACDVPEHVLMRVARGSQATLRASQEIALLDVDEGALADGALVPAEPTARAIEDLVRAHGYQREDVARRLGRASGQLQLGRGGFVTARTALLVRKLVRDAEG